MYKITKVNKDRMHTGPTLEHHLEIEDHGWERITVVEIDVLCEPYKNVRDMISKKVTKDKKLQWVIQNSFDGLYMYLSSCRTKFIAYAYLKSTHASFWRLTHENTHT